MTGDRWQAPAASRVGGARQRPLADRWRVLVAITSLVWTVSCMQDVPGRDVWAIDARGVLDDLVAGDVPVPDRAWPHVCARSGVGTGIGVLSGRSFRLEQPVAMVATDQWRPVVEFAGFPVALSGRVQGAMVIATATASLLHALGGERRSGGDHPAVPVVDGSSWRVRAPHGSEALDEDFMTAAGRAAREMPAGVHDALVRFGDDPGECGVLLLRGINLGPVPATPAGAAAVGSSGKDLTSEFALLAAARRLGQPVGYAPELGGRLVQDLIPNRDETDAQVSTSSKVRLDWHTEAAFHPHLPRYLLLACLRADVAAATLVSSIRHLVKVLDADVLDVLRQDRFHTAVDESYLGRRGTRVGPVGPVVRGPAGGERMWFDADLMRGVDAASEEALEVLRHTIEEHHVSVVLEAGDLLVVDNDIVVHGRSAFTPRWDGTDRWLQRSFVVADLGASSAERTGRIIDTRFLQ